MVIMLFVAALPPSQAASRSIGPSVGGATVTGRVFITGAQPAIDTYVSLAPVLQNNVIDYNNSSYTYTDNTGAFTFTDVQIGDYSMDIQPYCISDVLPLIDNRFSVSTIAPVNRGSITLPPAREAYQRQGHAQRDKYRAEQCIHQRLQLRHIKLRLRLHESCRHVYFGCYRRQLGGVD